MDEQDEQQSFQALKNKWAQQEALAQEQSQSYPPHHPHTQPITPTTARLSPPPPVPPKPSVSVINKVLSDENLTTYNKNDAKNIMPTKENLKQADLHPSKADIHTTRDDGLATDKPTEQQLPVLPPSLPTTPAPPRPSKPPRPPVLDNAQPSFPVHNTHARPVEETAPYKRGMNESLEEDNEIVDLQEDGSSDSESSEETNSSEGDNGLIEQVQRAYLQYTQSEKPHYIGAPGMKNRNRTSDGCHHDSSKHEDAGFATAAPLPKKTTKKPPPPPPPSKKYHSSARATPTLSPTTAAAPMAAPIIQPPSPPPPVVHVPIPSSSVAEVEAINVSPPLPPPSLPPRPVATTPAIPQLPPRPSQSTLARAHTIASSVHKKHPHSTPPTSLETPASSAAKNNTMEKDMVDTHYDTNSHTYLNTTQMKRANTTYVHKKAENSSINSLLLRSERYMTSYVTPDFSEQTRNAPLIVADKAFSLGHKGGLSALAVNRNVMVTGTSHLRTRDIHTGAVISTIHMDLVNGTTAGSGTSNANNSQQNAEASNKVRALVFAPSRTPVEEGRFLWAVRQDTMLTVIDLKGGGRGAGYKVISRRNDVHTAPVNFLLRYRNSEIWSIDESGVMYVWDVLSADYHSNTNPLLTAMPRRYLVTPHAVAATIHGSQLWMSSGRTLAVHPIPAAGSSNNHSHSDDGSSTVRIPNDIGNITRLCTVPYHTNRVFASHDDGKISMWDTETMERLMIVAVSLYGISSMVSVGEYQLWAGYNTGMIYVYDTRPENWSVLKGFKAHTGSVSQMVVDESTLVLDEHRGRLQVVTSDTHGYVGVWDGLLTEHWKDTHLLKHQEEYCIYDDAHVMICSWNIDANKPERITGDDDRAVREWLGTMEDPDIIVVGIQEIVDLESKKQTARSLFFKKKVDPHEAEEVLTHRYKLWHDYLVRMIAENYGRNRYTVIKTDQLVGLFSCIFVRTADMDRIIDIDSTSVKTGLKVMNKSIHGNKGGIAIRFVYDHSSLCFVNCHLAAGQSHVQQRNADAEGILQSAAFPAHDYADVFCHGGDGAMVFDHEYCFMSGDFNYRIQMNRNEVLKALTNTDKLAAWEKLQEQDQLLRQKSNNPLFRLLMFQESPIRFDPTYKYDPGTDFYDRSEKKRVPAWCDRVLYKGRKIENLFYRRFEARCSDHRPIAAGFKIKTKIADPNKRDRLMPKVEEAWKQYFDRYIRDKKAKYVADFERCTLNDAFRLLEESDWDVNETVVRLLDGSE